MPTPNPRPLRTLIVDSSEAFRDGVMRWAAERPELEVVGSAANGPEALTAVERLDPDLVLVDAVLPGLDGFRVVRSLKKGSRAPLAVIVTFVANSAVRAEAAAAGADGFVPKDDFTAAFELLLGDLVDAAKRRGEGLKRPERSTRPGSRIVRDP